MEHIVIGKKTLCGRRGGAILPAERLGPLTCPICAERYRAITWKQVRARIPQTAKEWAIYLLLTNPQERDKELRILISTLSIEVRQTVEAQRDEQGPSSPQA